MLQRMSDQHKISFLEEEKSSDIQKTSNVKQKKTIEQVAETQKSKNLKNKDNGFMTANYISSAITGDIKDTGGPTKYIKSKSSNTLWDSDKIAKLSKDIDSKTKTTQEKNLIATNKRDAEQKRMDDMVENLKNTDQTKASAVSSVGAFSGSNYKNLTNNMSIFDTCDFERLPKKTGGEQITEDAINRKNQKDDSWRGGKVINTKEVVSEFFDNLLQKRDK